MAQKNAIEEVKAWLTPTLIAILGYLLNSGIQDLKADLKELKQLGGIHEKRIQKLEYKVFGISSAFTLQHSNQFVFDKTKTLHYNGIKFYYA
jgi:hypothetical protein